MAAGLGFKTFTTGEVLTAADTNGYLMQGINVFASTAARDAAITSPQEGQFAFTKDTNGLWYYDGAAWVASGATGDIEGVTAGVGISGGGTSGTVTITNSMATEIAAKGDLIVGTGSATFDNLTVGANGTTLVADSSTSTGLKWAAAASGGGMTLLSTTTLSGTSTTISGISGSYLNLFILFERVTQNTTGGYLRMNLGAATFSQYNGIKESTGTAFVNTGSGTFMTPFGQNTPNSGYELFGQSTIFNYASTTTNNGKSVISSGASFSGAGSFGPTLVTSYLDSAAAISSIKFDYSNGGTISGTVKIYGVN